MEILNIFDNQPLFRYIKEEIRSVIYKNLFKTYIIISLFYIFFEDIKFIQSYIKAIQSLIDTH